MTTTDTILLEISERGNGFPSVGERVYDVETDTVYELTADFYGGRISTDSSGSGNSCTMEAVVFGDASDLTDEEFENLREVGVSVVEDGDEGSILRALVVGDRVEAGLRGSEDYDKGRIDAIENGVATVNWDSLVVTDHPLNDLTKI